MTMLLLLKMMMLMMISSATATATTITITITTMMMLMMLMMMMMPLPFFARFRPIPHSPRGARRDAPPRARRDARCCLVDLVSLPVRVHGGVAWPRRGGGAKAKSNHVVAGSLRRLPKDSWSRTVFCDKAND